MARRNQPGEDGVPAPGPETVLEDRPSPHPGELCLHNRAISATMVEERISCRIRKHPNDIDTGSEAPTGQHRAHRAAARRPPLATPARSEEHTSELQSRFELVCRLLLEKKN